MKSPDEIMYDMEKEIERLQQALVFSVFLADRIYDFEKPSDELLQDALGWWKSLKREQGNPHDGDCTKQAHTCQRCLYDGFVKEAGNLLTACRVAGGQ